MGLSTSYANILMFAFFLSALTLLMGSLASYLEGTYLESKAQGRFLKDRLGTDISISSISTSTSDNIVRVYAVNSGKSSLPINCTDLYLDREWISRGTMSEFLLLNTTFDPGLWNPGESLKLSVQYITDHGVPHEGRVVACNGVSASKIFYWAT